MSVRLKPCVGVGDGHLWDRLTPEGTKCLPRSLDEIPDTLFSYLPSFLASSTSSSSSSSLPLRLTLSHSFFPDTTTPVLSLSPTHRSDVPTTHTRHASDPLEAARTNNPRDYPCGVQIPETFFFSFVSLFSVSHYHSLDLLTSRRGQYDTMSLATSD